MLEPVLSGDGLAGLSLINIPVLCVTLTLPVSVLPLPLTPLILGLLLAQVIIYSAGTGRGLGSLIIR